MTFLLRLVRKNRWYFDEKLSWLSDNEYPADPLFDFATSDNKLSVWVVEDDFSNLEKLIIALAANRQKLDKLDYLLFSLDILEQAGVEPQRTNGDSPDDEANNWHLSLINLSIRKVTDLVTYIWLSPLTKTDRVPAKKVTNLLLQSIREDTILVGKIRQSMLRKEVEDLLNPPTPN